MIRNQNLEPACFDLVCTADWELEKSEARLFEMIEQLTLNISNIKYLTDQINSIDQINSTD